MDTYSTRCLTALSAKIHWIQVQTYNNRAVYDVATGKIYHNQEDKEHDLWCAKDNWTYSDIIDAITYTDDCHLHDL